MPFNHPWAKGAVVYQIYPRSFYDSNADGVGDLAGIVQKLDYLQNLGVSAIWLSPFYRSPMADFGYDIADYRDVDPIFGSLDDARDLINSSHERNIRVMVDLVPNHTSDEHAWFKASVSSRTGQYADYYIWRDPSGTDETGQPLPPNNWINVFSGGSAWEYNEHRGQFYLHSFHARQPDLNWDNPTVRREIADVMRFWLDIGVDGFRVDAVNFIAKDPSYADDPVNPHWHDSHHHYDRLQHRHSQSGPRLYEYLSELAGVLREPAYADRNAFMVTEGYPQTADHVGEYLRYYLGVDASVAAPFCFEGLQLPWEAGKWTEFMRDFTHGLSGINEAVPAFAFSNHDNSRPVSRRGEQAARSAAVLLLTLPGMVYVYNGDELGMRDGVIPRDRIVDPGAADGPGRDPERTPMQWSSAHNAGFSTAKTTWLPVNDDYQTVNVEAQAANSSSFLSLYKCLISLRRDHPALSRGSFGVFETGNDALLGFERRYNDNVITVIINFSDQATTYESAKPLGKVMLSTHTRNDNDNDKSLQLAPNEGVVYRNRDDLIPA